MLLACLKYLPRRQNSKMVADGFVFEACSRIVQIVEVALIAASHR